MNGTSISLSVCTKTLQISLLAVAVCLMTGAADTNSRFNKLNHRLMCTCGCAELLGECNHVGCQSSGQELNELRTAINAGKSDGEIMNAFVVKYGATVLAAPTMHGFDLVAWVAPFGVFAGALIGTILLVRRWASGAMRPATVTIPISDELRAEIRRETGGEGDS
jgi:cytochrome c-type biogenesis protein CcmH/NrfF